MATNADVRARKYLGDLHDRIDAAVMPVVTARLAAASGLPSPAVLADRLAQLLGPAANRMAEQVGPNFYDTGGVRVVLAKPGREPISKQAVDARRKRHSILAMRTSDGHWVYPTWQFRNHQVLAGLPEVLRVFGEHSAWSVGTWLTTPTGDLDDVTPVQWLEAGRDRDHLLRVARATAHRWAA